MSLLSERSVYSVEQASYKFCYSCKFDGDASGKTCQKCGKPLHARQQIRVLGGRMLALSLILVVGMAYIIYSMDQSIINSGKPGATTKWTASPAFITGLWHLVIGRRNLILIGVVFSVTAVLFIFSKFLAE
jgi:hypothetical protein